MTGAYLPGDSTVELRDAKPVPEPGHGEVLLRMKASTITAGPTFQLHLPRGKSISVKVPRAIRA